MNLTVIGTGYVGVVSGTCFADIGNQVYCVDKDLNKIKKLHLSKQTVKSHYKKIISFKISSVPKRLLLLLKVGFIITWGQT